jgi:TrmH family RNA methyltransferase
VTSSGTSSSPQITSTKNPKVAEATKLTKRGLRDRRRRFLVEGAQAAAEAVSTGAAEQVFHVPGSAGRVPEVVEAARVAGLDEVSVSEGVMAHLTSAVTPQGIVAVARYVDVPLGELGRGAVAVLCSVRDPGNAGTVLRSADAFGAAGVVFTTDSVDSYNAKAVRSSAGSLFHVPVVRDVPAAAAVEELRGAGATIVAAAADGENDVSEVDLSGHTAILLGNEAWGLPAEVRAMADGSVRVPIVGRAESLNLAAAAAILLFQAGAAGRPGRSDLADIISASVHDVRLPLTALKGFAFTLVDRWDRFQDQARHDMVEGMLLDIERVSAMIALMVDAARIEQGRVAPVSEPRAAAESLAWVAEVFRRSRDYPDVVAEGDAPVAVDRERVQALLLALCDGAMWFGQEGDIRIEAHPEGAAAVIEVRRAGDGLDEAEAERMFAGPGEDGSKIGLHVARRVASALGGSLVALSGDGVRFRLTLPS